MGVQWECEGVRGGARGCEGVRGGARGCKPRHFEKLKAVDVEEADVPVTIGDRARNRR